MNAISGLSGSIVEFASYAILQAGGRGGGGGVARRCMSELFATVHPHSKGTGSQLSCSRS